MAKGIGLIGNFRGKVGNMVGYNLKDSNNKQTQGVRVYQPIVKNPKTYAQAEQRAKLAPINATYRALKMIIDRGQEGKAYGNKSRLAWLSAAMKAFNGGWFEKDAVITAPALVPLTKGTLQGVSQSSVQAEGIYINIIATAETAGNTVGKVSQCILAANPFLKNGDQVTSVGIYNANGIMSVDISSFVIDTTSTDVVESSIETGDDTYMLLSAPSENEMFVAGAIIVSREGNNSEHLRSTVSLTATSEYDNSLLADAAKEAAIKSYMTSGSNTDWAEESLQG